MDLTLVERILAAFTLPDTSLNEGFNALDDFNLASALPMRRLGPQVFLLFQPYSLAEALYDAPFFWMGEDKAYRGTAANHRGRFTEEFAHERLAMVFGKDRVYSNINIYEHKGTTLAEIDVLVIFGDRAIVVQAKSKRLTIEARKGNDQVIKDDFKKSVQDSYDQGRRCALLLGDTRYTLADEKGNEIELKRDFKEIYLLCLVSDHYPALSFQARQFLKHEETNVIKPPFVLDVFLLDAISEFLPSPIRFLSYVSQRTLYAGRVLAVQELTILSYHLKHNLWLDGEQDLVMLDEAFSADLDIAMSVRRNGVAGNATPEGVLTRWADTTLGRILRDIEAEGDSRAIDLGFLLLTIGEDTIADLNRGIDQAVAKTRRDDRPHDITAVFGDGGITVHCTDEPMAVASPVLQRHCERRKYIHRAKAWFGVCVRSRDARIRFALNFEYPWAHVPTLEEQTKHSAKGANSAEEARHTQRRSTKMGRNDPCLCGSGRKYKKCCSKQE